MRATRHLLRSARASTLSSLRRPYLVTTPGRLITPVSNSLQSHSQPPHQVSFSSIPFSRKGLQPGSSNPEPPSTEPSHGDSTSAGAAQITDAEYHELADEYLNTLVLAMEELAERSSDGVEAEFSAGVLTITHPKHGTYVLNKQPPNRQIWLSSPVSGPKRYDWVIPSSSQHHKSDSTIDSGDDGESGGKWIYLRDGSSLSELLKKELGVETKAGGGEGGVGDASSVGGPSSTP